MAAFPPNYGGMYCCYCGATGCPDVCIATFPKTDDQYSIKLATPVKPKPEKKLPYWQQLNNRKR